MMNLHFNENTKDLTINGIQVGELIVMEDGFYQFFPILVNRGYWTTDMLRAIADKVDDVNKKWKKEVEKVNQEPQETPVKPTLTKIDPP